MKKLFKQRTDIESLENKALSPTVVKLGLVSFFADVSSEMLYPITPIFLTLVLGASVANVGIIEGVAEGIASLLKTYSGRWSDRIQKRKTFVWVGYLFAAIAKPITGGATSWFYVLFARGFDRLGKGIRSAPRDALLAESVKPQYLGAAFGWHRMMDTLGAAIGPLIAILFLQVYSEPQHLRWIYYLAVVPGLISVLVVFTVKESTHEKSRAKDSALKLQLSSLPKSFKTYLTAWGIFSLTNSSDVFLLLKAQKSGLSLTMTILLYAFYNLLYAISSPYLGHLSDRFGRKWVLISGLFVFALVYAAFGFAIEPWQFWCLFGIYGFYMAATEGVGKALAVDLVPKEFKATGLGLLGTVSGFATIVASSAAGLLWDHLGSQWSFFFGATGAVLAICVLFTLPNKPVAHHF